MLLIPQLLILRLARTSKAFFSILLYLMAWWCWWFWYQLPPPCQMSIVIFLQNTFSIHAVWQLKFLLVAIVKKKIKIKPKDYNRCLLCFSSFVFIFKPIAAFKTLKKILKNNIPRMSMNVFHFTPLLALVRLGKLNHEKKEELYN